ncbi:MULTISPECIES: HEPN domain-containing protein [Streptomyces]|uniref:ApeA N-terminal domain 1-containing protein n=1 Tax=Streptomyces TaxID=1883 RepID=UPI001782D323|nr:HEPN domain-containing protein [Streptomyces sp. CRB46]
MAYEDPDGSHPGVFWSSKAPDEAIPGRLVLSGPRPRVILSSPITPALVVKSRTKGADGSTIAELGPPESQPDLTLHGEVIHGYARKVTLFECRTVRRRSQGLLGPDFEEQTLEAEWSILGSHEDEDFAIETCSFRFPSVDEWTARGSYNLEFRKDGSSGRISYERPEDLTAPLAENQGTVTVKTDLRPPNWNLNGAGFSYYTRMILEKLPHVTISQLINQYIGPVIQLVTLCTSKDASPTSIEVKDSSDARWCLVHHAVVKEAHEKRKPLYPLLTLEDVGILGVAEWISSYPQVSPIPALVSNIAASDHGRTVENKVLELAASLEGLHRRLYPQVRRMSKTQADRVRRMARDSVPEEYARIVNDALFHLYDPTYHERLVQLLDDVEEIAPGIVGDRDQWLHQVKSARNGFAHQLPNAGKGDIESLHALSQSLRWVLTFRLLRLTGMNERIISRRIREYHPYADFLTYAKRANPDAWPASAG